MIRFFDSFFSFFIFLLPLPIFILSSVSLSLIRSRVKKWLPDTRWDSFFSKFGGGKVLFAAFIFVVSISFLVAGFAAWENSQLVSSAKPRLLVLGLDGATWDIIDPMMKSGELPTLKAFCDCGARGVLQSLEPMQSPDLWTSIATGLPHDRHGISGFFCTRADLKAYRIWDIAQQHGLTVGLFSWLITWPPRDPFSFIIPSWMARTPETRPYEYTCIQELNLEQNRYGGSINPIWDLWECIQLGAHLRGVERMAWFYMRDRFGLSEEVRLAAKTMAETRIQTDLFISLLRNYQPDIATFTLYGTDKLGHRFWHTMDPDAFPGLEVKKENPYRDVIQDYYRCADEEFGRILKVLPPDSHVMLISDHGFKADPGIPRQFFLDVPQLLRTLGVSRLIHYFTIERQAILEPIFSDSQTIESLKTMVEKIYFIPDNDPVFQVEVENEKRIILRPNFSLSWNEESPLVTHSSLVIQGKSYPIDHFFFLRAFSGTHDPSGIVLVKGPMIRPDSTLEKANLLDLAPTMLYLLDLPISRELPGRILSDAISDRSLQKQVAKYVDTYGEPPKLPEESIAMPESLMEHLRSLDYVK